MVALVINPLNAKLNPIRHLLALLGAHYIFNVGRIRVKCISVAVVSKVAYRRRDNNRANGPELLHSTDIS